MGRPGSMKYFYYCHFLFELICCSFHKIITIDFLCPWPNISHSIHICFILYEVRNMPIFIENEFNVEVANNLLIENGGTNVLLNS